MVTAADIEYTRRLFVQAIGTDSEALWRGALEALVDQAKREAREQTANEDLLREADSVVRGMP